MGRYFVFFLLFLFHYCCLFCCFCFRRETDKSLSATDWMMGTVCRVALLGEPNTHRQAGLSLSLFFLSFFSFSYISLYNNPHSSHNLFPLLLLLFSIFYVCVGWLAALYILQLRNDRRTKNAGLWWMRVPSAPSLALKRTWMGKINDERAQATLIPFSFLSLSLFSRCCEPKPTLLNSPF